MLVLGCAGSQHPGARLGGSLGAAPPIHSEEEYAAARTDYDALALADPARTPRRRALLDYLVKEINVAVERAHPEDAEASFGQALSLFAPAELRAPRKALGDEADLLAAARAYERAFRRRGAHQPVLTALAAEIALAPGDGGAKARFAEVTSWLEGAAAGDDEGPDGAARIIDDLESIARVLPSPFIVDELVKRYHAPRVAPTPPHGKPTLRALREMMGEDQRGSRAYELARVFLRVSEPARAAGELAALRTAGKLRGDEGELGQLLDKVSAKDSTPTDWVGLAMYVVRQSRERNSDDRDVALRICLDASARFEHVIEPRVCSGQLALSMEQLGVAMRSYEAARAIDPTRRDAWEALAQIYQARLFQMVTEDNLDVSGLPAELKRVEAFHAEAGKRFPQQPLKPGVAGAVFEVGRGYYNAGHINEAEKYFASSIELEPTGAALELAAAVRAKRGDPQRAAVLLERAINSSEGAKEQRLYRRAKLRRVLADAVEAAGDAAAAAATRTGAVEDWDVLIDLGLQKEFAAEANLERGKVLYQLGERDDALRSFSRSIDAMPDRGSTYADVIAFLVPRGELADVLDAYHRALGRSEVSDYLKVYCSLWIVDLAHRAGQPEDPLALAYLHAADGGKWFDDLARWSTGREPESELLARATTPARRAEAAFYRAMKALREGHADYAQRLWKEVIATDMMAFFEYDMAALYLKEGAPAQPRIPAGGSHARPHVADPRQPAHPNAPRAPHTEPPPDGSI